jgi:hypothetical protein
LAVRKKKRAKKVVSRSRVAPAGPSGGEIFGWAVLVFLLKVIGIAFLVQGFVLQLATGVLYYGLLHYSIGLVAMWGAYMLKCGKLGWCHGTIMKK